MEKRGLFKNLKKETKFETKFERIHEDYNDYSDWIKLKKENIKFSFFLTKTFFINNFYQNNIEFEENFKIYFLEFDFFLKEKNILIKLLNKNIEKNDSFDQNIYNFLVKDEYTVFFIELSDYKNNEEKILEFIKEIN